MLAMLIHCQHVGSVPGYLNWHSVARHTKLKAHKILKKKKVEKRSEKETLILYVQYPYIW